MFGKKTDAGTSTPPASKPAMPAAPSSLSGAGAAPAPSLNGATGDKPPPPPAGAATPKPAVPSAENKISDAQMAQLRALSAEGGAKRVESRVEAQAAAEKPKPADSSILENHQPEEVLETKGPAQDSMTSLRLQRARNRIWIDLRDSIDLKALARMDSKAAREEVSSAVQEIARFRNLDVTPSEIETICKECGDDMLGYGPLEVLLERDDIADIM
ncbi:MAG TPA: CpaF family protein, partial [Micavibrio sp.]